MPTPALSRLLPWLLLKLQNSLRLSKSQFTALALVVYSAFDWIGMLCLWTSSFTLVVYVGLNSYALYTDPEALLAPSSGNEYEKFVVKDVLLFVLGMFGLWVTGTLYTISGNVIPLPQRCFATAVEKEGHAGTASGTARFRLHDWVTHDDGSIIVRPSWFMCYRRHASHLSRSHRDCGNSSGSDSTELPVLVAVWPIPLRLPAPQQHQRLHCLHRV
jgi:hypothetical protein